MLAMDPRRSVVYCLQRIHVNKSYWCSPVIYHSALNDINYLSKRNLREEPCFNWRPSLIQRMQMYEACPWLFEQVLG